MIRRWNVARLSFEVRLQCIWYESHLLTSQIVFEKKPGCSYRPMDIMYWRGYISASINNTLLVEWTHYAREHEILHSCPAWVKHTITIQTFQFTFRRTSTSASKSVSIYCNEMKWNANFLLLLIKLNWDEF